MNNTLKRAIASTLKSWEGLTDEQKGPCFEDSVRRLSDWMEELENEN